MHTGTRLRAVTCAVVIVLAAGLGSSACSSKRWCEFDATDTEVADSYCEKNTPGYEWEGDGDSGSKKSKKTTSKNHH